MAFSTVSNIFKRSCLNESDINDAKISKCSTYTALVLDALIMTAVVISAFLALSGNFQCSQFVQGIICGSAVGATALFTLALIPVICIGIGKACSCKNKRIKVLNSVVSYILLAAITALFISLVAPKMKNIHFLTSSGTFTHGLIVSVGISVIVSIILNKMLKLKTKTIQDLIV